MKIISQYWKEEQEEKIHNREAISITTQYNILIQWLVIKLNSFYIPYKIYSIGAGVKTLTTNTDICPCCKRKL